MAIFLWQTDTVPAEITVSSNSTARAAIKKHGVPRELRPGNSEIPMPLPWILRADFLWETEGTAEYKSLLRMANIFLHGLSSAAPAVFTLMPMISFIAPIQNRMQPGETTLDGNGVSGLEVPETVG